MPDREHVARIVSAYAKRNALAADQLPTLIATVHGALAGVERGGELPVLSNEPVPAVPVRRSVQPDAITCLDCGYRGKMLKRRAYAELAEGGRRDGKPGGLSPRTRRHIHRILSSALARAVEQQVIARNPAEVFLVGCPRSSAVKWQPSPSSNPDSY